MFDQMLGLALLATLLGTAVLYWLRVQEQLHERRMQARLSGVRRVAAVMRATLAEQRRIA